MSVDLSKRTIINNHFGSASCMRAYMNYTDLHNDIFYSKADCFIDCDQG